MQRFAYTAKIYTHLWI